jgi:hypothetical protein
MVVLRLVAQPASAEEKKNTDTVHRRGHLENKRCGLAKCRLQLRQCSLHVFQSEMIFLHASGSYVLVSSMKCVVNPIE